MTTENKAADLTQTEIARIRTIYTLARQAMRIADRLMCTDMAAATEASGRAARRFAQLSKYTQAEIDQACRHYCY